MKEKFENFLVLILSFVIGTPLGIIVGLFHWIKFPLDCYYHARANLAMQRIRKAKEQLTRHQGVDIWEKHIKRMEEKKSHDN
ncbi:hypothetical protein N9973_00650 [bacterium]|nr:hypothetical protein [bacterium]